LARFIRWVVGTRSTASVAEPEHSPTNGLAELERGAPTEMLRGTSPLFLIIPKGVMPAKLVFLHAFVLVFGFSTLYAGLRQEKK
jgi:hypothetical protein